VRAVAQGLGRRAAAAAQQQGSAVDVRPSRAASVTGPSIRNGPSGVGVIVAAPGPARPAGAPTGSVPGSEKRVRSCALSHQGLFAEAPQRHSVACPASRIPVAVAMRRSPAQR
jgi:hypothetical protein